MSAEPPSAAAQKDRRLSAWCNLYIHVWKRCAIELGKNRVNYGGAPGRTKNFISLPPDTTVARLPEGQPFPLADQKESRREPYRLVLTTRGRSYVMSFANPDEQHVWLLAIQARIEHCMKHLMDSACSRLLAQPPSAGTNVTESVLDLQVCSLMSAKRRLASHTAPPITATDKIHGCAGLPSELVTNSHGGFYVRVRVPAQRSDFRRVRTSVVAADVATGARWEEDFSFRINNFRSGLQLEVWYGGTRGRHVFVGQTRVEFLALRDEQKQLLSLPIRRRHFRDLYDMQGTLQFSVQLCFSGKTTPFLAHLGALADPFPLRLQTGDLVLFSSDRLFSYLQRGILWHYYDHVAVVVQAESQMLMLLESTTAGVELYHLGKHLTSSRNAASLTIRRLCPVASVAHKVAALNYVELNRGRPYKKDLLQVVGGVALGINTREDYDSGLFCSEVVASLFVSMGLLDGSRIITSNISPNQFGLDAAAPSSTELAGDSTPPPSSAKPPPTTTCLPWIAPFSLSASTRTFSQYKHEHQSPSSKSKSTASKNADAAGSKSLPSTSQPTTVLPTLGDFGNYSSGPKLTTDAAKDAVDAQGGANTGGGNIVKKLFSALSKPGSSGGTASATTTSTSGNRSAATSLTTKPYAEPRDKPATGRPSSSSVGRSAGLFESRNFAALLATCLGEPLAALEQLRSLDSVAMGALVGQADLSSGQTLLHAAATSGCLPLLALLLSSLSVQSPRQPAHGAISISEFSSPLEMRDHLGRTPLLCAAVAQSESCVRALLQAQSDAAAIAYDGRTLLSLLCCWVEFPQTLADDCWQAAPSLCALASHLITGGQTPLMDAVRNGRVAVVEWLLSKGVDANALSDPPGETPSSPVLSARSSGALGASDSSDLAISAESVAELPEGWSVVDALEALPPPPSPVNERLLALCRAHGGLNRAERARSRSEAERRESLRRATTIMMIESWEEWLLSIGIDQPFAKDYAAKISAVRVPAAGRPDAPPARLECPRDISALGSDFCHQLGFKIAHIVIIHNARKRVPKNLQESTASLPQ